jgi:hypothetical protein
LRHEHDLGPRTFLAYDEARARYVVAKRLAPGTPDDVQQAALAEAKRAFDLQDETIVAADSLAKDALVSEFVEGEPFDVAASQLSFGRCTRLLLSAARALMAAHEAGIPHLGLAPDRMLVTPSRNVRIVGFGFGAVEPERGDAFAAPEQLQNGEIWQPADVFSFGAVMYAVLAGRAPFGGATPEQVRESIAARLTLPRQIDPSIPADLQALCLSCLERDPHQRPLMYDVVVELERIVAGQPVRVRPHHYRDLVRAGLREHGAQLDLWEQQGIATADQRDAVEVVYRRISDQEEHWLFDTRRITLRRVALYAGCALFAAAITAFAWFGGTGMLPLIAVVVVFGAGLFAQLRDELAGACAFLGAGCVAAAPAVYAFQPEPVVAAGVALALSLFSFLRVRVALFAWTTVAFTAATVVGVAQQFGFAPEGYAALAALLPLSLLLPRAAWAQPFRWAGALALVAAPFAVGARVPDVLDFTFLDTWYAALAAHGLLLIGLQAWLDRTSNVDMRRTARAFEWAGVGMVTSALFANALAHGTGLALAVYVAAPVLLLAISPWRGRRVFLVAGLLGLAAACYLPVAMGAMSLGAFALTAAGTGAALAFGVLIPSLRK